VHELSDGTPVLVREMVPTDRSWLETFVVADLSPESRHSRFLVAVHELTESMLVRLVDAVDGVDHVALVAVVDPGGAAQARRGVARYVRSAEDSSTADFALAVADVMHGLGLGRLLSGQIARHARCNGIAHFTASVFADNVASRRVLAGMGTVVSERMVGPGVVDVTVSLARVGAVS